MIDSFFNGDFRPNWDFRPQAEISARTCKRLIFHRRLELQPVRRSRYEVGAAASYYLVSGGTAIRFSYAAGLVVAFAVMSLLLLSNRQDKQSCLVATRSRINQSRLLKLLLAPC